MKRSAPADDAGSILKFRIGFSLWFSAVASQLGPSLVVGFGGIQAVDTEFPYRVAISTATYRGARCPTLKTAEKQPKGVPSGSRWSSRKTAGKTAETPEKQPKSSQNSFFSGVLAVFPAVFRLLYRDPLGTLFGCFSAVFNVGHLAPLVGGCGDCKYRVPIVDRIPVCRPHFRFLDHRWPKETLSYFGKRLKSDQGVISMRVSVVSESLRCGRGKCQFGLFSGFSTPWPSSSQKLCRECLYFEGKFRDSWSSQVQAQLKAATLANQPRSKQIWFEPLLIRFRAGSEEVRSKAVRDQPCYRKRLKIRSGSPLVL